MIVEQLIELLRQRNPEAWVWIEVPEDVWLTSWNPQDGHALLNPDRVQVGFRTGAVYIHATHHDSLSSG